MGANSEHTRVRRRWAFFGVFGFCLLSLAVILPKSATAQTSRSSESGNSRESELVVTNIDAQPVQVSVDGISVARIPGGRKLRIPLESRQYVVTVSPVGAQSSSVHSAVSIDLAEREVASFDATVHALALRSRVETPGALALTAPNPATRKPIESPRGVSIASVLFATLGLGAAAAFIISQLSIERERVFDERTGARMQQLSSQSLNSLPPLSMDVAARMSR